MYTRPRFEDGESTTFGVSGKLWRDALIMYDRRTRSLWSQIDGRAKAGPLTGQGLEKIPSQVTTWKAWKRRHPETLVLVKPKLERSPYSSYHERSSWVGLPWTRGGRDRRLAPKDLVLGIDLGASRGLAVSLQRLKSEDLLAGEVSAIQGDPSPDAGEEPEVSGNDSELTEGIPVLVVAPDDPRAGLAYRREVQGQVLDFFWQTPSSETSAMGRLLVDRQTGSHWNWETGEAVAGPLMGARLGALPSTPIYWSTWVSFHPAAALW